MLLQKRVQAGDLASHLYNTWLVQLVKAGEPLGLELVPQYSNVLFDWCLEGLWHFGGPAVAEKVAVSAAVLAFFWGSFALVSRLSGLSAWASAPVLAMLAYGWIYFQGFFNYYLSCAFGFWAIFFAAGPARVRTLAAPALALSAVGHLLGAAVASGLVAHLLIRNTAGSKWRARLLSVEMLGLALASVVAGVCFEGRWDAWRFLHLSGATPFLLRPEYILPAILVLAAWLAAGAQAWRQRDSAWLRGPAAELVVLAAAALLLLPASIQWPGTRHPLNFIDWRLAAWFALLLQALLCPRLPSRWIAVIASLAAAPYFALFAADARRLNGMEEEFHQAVRRAPPRSRVISLVTGLPEGRNPINHMIDRACIGHCFSYANYEPATAQFRLRARPDSPTNLASSADLKALQAGGYRIRSRDLPLFAVQRRPGVRFGLELRPLAPGEEVRREPVALSSGPF